MNKYLHTVASGWIFINIPSTVRHAVQTPKGVHSIILELHHVVDVLNSDVNLVLMHNA